MLVHIACVVEGHGETEAVPILVRRIAQKLDPEIQIRFPHPIRTPRSKLLKRGELERAVDLAARKITSPGGILVVLDSDDDCPAQLGPELLDRVHRTRGSLPLAVVLAKREFEAWFLAAADSLRGQRGLGPELTPHPEPETVRGAKEWLSQRMADAHYVETIDQPALTAVFDLDMARRADSFDKCYREVERLLASMCAAESGS